MALLGAMMVTAGFAGVTAHAQETIYVGGSGRAEVEINQDVIDRLGDSRTVPEMLRSDMPRIRQTARTGALPLPGEAARPGAVPLPSVRPTQRSSVPVPIPTAPRQQPQPSTPLAAPSSPSAPALPSAVAARPPAPAAPSPASSAVPPAPKVASTAAPVVAPPARVAIEAPVPPATRAAPPPPPAASRTAAAVPPATVPAAPAARTEPRQQVAAAPANQPAPQPPAARASAAGTVSLAFAPDSRDLPAGADRQLDQIAQAMKQQETIRLQISAYAEKGDKSDSQARRLSLSRALEVRSYLIGKGVAGTRMDVRALGDQTEGAPKDRVDLNLVTR